MDNFSAFLGAAIDDLWREIVSVDIDHLRGLMPDGSYDLAPIMTLADLPTGVVHETA